MAHTSIQAWRTAVIHTPLTPEINVVQPGSGGSGPSLLAPTIQYQLNLDFRRLMILLLLLPGTVTVD